MRRSSAPRGKPVSSADSPGPQLNRALTPSGTLTCVGDRLRVEESAVTLSRQASISTSLAPAPHFFGGLGPKVDAHLSGQENTAWGIETVLIDGRDLKVWEKALDRPTKVVFLETPSNPMLELVDLRAVCDLAHAAGAIVVVDNVFATSFAPAAWAISATAPMAVTSSSGLAGLSIRKALVLGRTAFFQRAHHRVDVA